MEIGDDQIIPFFEEVAEALNDNPHIKKVRVEGHTDSVGSYVKNLRLSRQSDNVLNSQSRNVLMRLQSFPRSGEDYGREGHYRDELKGTKAIEGCSENS